VDVTVQERRVFYASEYEITAPPTTYSARKASLKVNDHLELLDASGNLVAHIDGSFSPLRAKHEFHLADGRQYRFGCEDLWTRVFTCEGNDESYTLYEHKGLQFSIFRDSRQIAAMTKNRVVLCDGNKYDIRIDADADLVVVLCMTLAINSAEKDSSKEAVSVDFGNVGAEARPFDETWQPR
jgi:uncharacterized protein YxjI